MPVHFAESEFENASIHDFLIQSTFPLLKKIDGRFCIIGTGTLFKIGDRRFIVTTAHTMDAFHGETWSFSTSPIKGEVWSLGKATYRRFSEDTLDTCIIELESDRTIAKIEEEWRFLKFEDIWLPDHSADAIVVAGYPSVRTEWNKNNVRGRVFVLRSSLIFGVPPEAANSEDPVNKAVDFFVHHQNAVNELTGEDVSDVKLHGMSGCSIWAYRKRGWSSRGVWSPTFVMRIIGIQSAYLPNRYVRGKNWGAILLAIGRVDAELAAAAEEMRQTMAARLIQDGYIPSEPVDSGEST